MKLSTPYIESINSCWSSHKCEFLVRVHYLYPVRLIRVSIKENNPQIKKSAVILFKLNKKTSKT